jgi:quinol monooxygenase YgiN
MGSQMIRYKVRPDRAADNVALVEKVYEQLNRERPDGLHYATFKLPDGVSFMHIVFESDQPGRILNETAAFQAFVKEIDSRCDEPPVATELTIVGSYGLPG